MTQIKSLLADIPTSLPQELVEVLVTAGSVRIERIVSQGHVSPEGFWYDQDQAEWVLVVSGAARLQFEDEASARELRAGSYVNIPAHRRHRIEWTDPAEPTIWLAVHYS